MNDRKECLNTWCNVASYGIHMRSIQTMDSDASFRCDATEIVMPSSNKYLARLLSLMQRRDIGVTSRTEHEAPVDRTPVILL